MSKWTPEPWRQGGNEIVGGDGTPAAFVVCKAAYGHVSPAPVFSYIGPEYADHRPVVDANMARIVACVNGCKGINPEAVPGLLAACKGTMLGITEVRPGFFTIGGNAVGILRAAIAAAERGAS